MIDQIESGPKFNKTNASERVTEIRHLRQQILNCLNSLIPQGSTCVIVDFPNHPNVGDSAIYLGEIAYLRSRQCHIAYVCDHENYNAAALRAALPQDGIIIIHGGGNFGDLYPHHQALREKVLSEFLRYRIVQMPQSVYFQNAANLIKSIKTIEAHPDFHFLLRDFVSLDFAKNNFHSSSMNLCPDMAMMLDIKYPRNTKKMLGVAISRTDDEKSTPFSSKNNSAILVTDWLSETKPKMQWLYDWGHREASNNRSKIFSIAKSQVAVKCAQAMARQRLARGLTILSCGENIITDRLHAVILGWLAGSNVLYSDNNYNKLGNFLATWLPNSQGILSFDSIEGAVDYAVNWAPTLCENASA